MATVRPGEASGAGGDAVEPVEGADTRALAGDVFIRFQEIKLAGDGCSSNHRFLLYDDGRFFLQENKAADCANRPAGSRFNAPFGPRPVKTLGLAAVRAIHKALADNGFAGMAPSYSPDGKVFDGSMKILEVRLGQGVKRVISVKSASQPLETILEVIWAQVS